MEWFSALEIAETHIVKIFTPQGSGTGFLASFQDGGKLCTIATAAHVIDHAHLWESPIRIQHYKSGKTSLIHHGERAIFVDSKKDTALILMNKGDLPLPSTPLNFIAEGRHVKPGAELAWAGFPAVASENLCLFTGCVSARLKEGAYLIDGVAINGVSGGPTFFKNDKDIFVVGVISAYIPNRATSTGDVLPGLSLASDVSQIQKLIKDFNSIDQAKKAESPPVPILGEPKNEPKNQSNTPPPSNG